MEKQEIREIEQRCMEEEKNLVFDAFSQTEALKLIVDSLKQYLSQR